MKYKLICIDIDGTLLDDKKRLLPPVKQAISNVAKMGVVIVLASGRMPAGVELVERELEISCTKICNAGSYIISGDQCIGLGHISVDTMKGIEKEIAQKNGVPLWIFQEKEWYVTDVDSYVEREIEIICHQPQIASAESLAEQWTKEAVKPHKMLIAANPKKIPDIYRQIKERDWADIEIACSSKDFIEIFPKGISKGTALITVCEKLGISLEETVAFGDQELDLPMIEAAGLGIAMGNAIEQVKERADIVTKSNNEAGIAYAIEHFIMG